MVIKWPLNLNWRKSQRAKLGEEVMNQSQEVTGKNRDQKTIGLSGSTINSSVAWFKIANLIERREREKALSIYKLMVHSLPDRAYALQLEGDILLSFGDKTGACEKYMQAALLYRDSKQWLDAASVYEHIRLLNKENSEAFIYLLACYAQLGWGKKFSRTLEEVIIYLSKNVSDEKLVTNAFRVVIESAKVIDNIIFKASLHGALMEVLLKIPKGTAEKIEPIINKYF